VNFRRITHVIIIIIIIIGVCPNETVIAFLWALSRQTDQLIQESACNHMNTKAPEGSQNGRASFAMYVCQEFIFNLKRKRKRKRKEQKEKKNCR
jgi:hypothetical protein